MVENDAGHNNAELDMTLSKAMPTLAEINAIAPDKLAPNVWTVMQKWIFALPAGSDAQRKRKAILQVELERIVKELGDTPGLGKDGVNLPFLVFNFLS